MKNAKQYRKMESLAMNVEDSIAMVSKEICEFNHDENSEHIASLTDRLSRLYEKAGITPPEIEEPPVVDTHSQPKENIQNQKVSFPDELSKEDIVMTCIAGGIAVLVDYLVVKIPKSTNIIRNGTIIHQEGSPMTSLLRNIGFGSDGKTSAWVKSLEKFFKVPFDKSIVPGEKGFTPNSHRLYSLAHDPSPSGLLWAIKDILMGTTTYIDRSGYLKMTPTHSSSVMSKLFCPIIWIGHIISDIFTKAGVPIPGTSMLRTLQIGSFGEKKRTIGQVVEYMYLGGFDLRHLATMSIENACIEFILRIYHVLTRQQLNQFGVPVALIEAEKSMQAHRLSKMRVGAYAIAATGNLTKMSAYCWNPLALNLPIWIELLRASLSEYQRCSETNNLYIEAVKNREQINRTFASLEEQLKTL